MKVEQLANILREQADILEQRAKEHGTFDVFHSAACIATQKYFPCTPLMVAQVLSCMKEARMAVNPKRDDSFLDLLNYQAIATMFQRNQYLEQERERNAGSR